MQKLTRNSSSDSSFLTLFVDFSMLIIISITIDYIHQLCSIYAKIPCHLLAVREE